MSAVERKRKPRTVPVLTRVTLDEREAVQALAWAEGCNSLSSWIRQQIVRRLKETDAEGSERESAHAVR